MNRREAMQTLGALAAAEWSGADLDPDEFESWGDERGFLWTLEAEGLAAHAFGAVSTFEVRDGDFEDVEAQVSTGSDGVGVSVCGEGEHTDSSFMGTFTPEQARELAVTIYMAAEEVDARGYQE